jgi:hypothetical protein
MELRKERPVMDAGTVDVGIGDGRKKKAHLAGT